MDKVTYLKKAVKSGACYYKTWLIDAVAIVDFPDKPPLVDPVYIEKPGIKKDEVPRFNFEEHPYQLFNHNNVPVFLNPETKEWEPVEGYVKGKGFYNFKDEITLEPGDLINVDRKLTTWVGNVFFNQCVLVYPFGGLIPFQQGKLSISKIEDIIVSKLESVPEAGDVRDESKIYVDILEKYYYDAAYSLSGWTLLAVPAATPYTLITDPNIRKRRIELLNQYSDQLDDPVIIAKIMGELIAMDMDFQAKDPEAGYLQPGKSFDVVRAKAFLMHGIEVDFNDPTKIVLIDRPLSEGWDLTKLPYMVNSLIDGSFYRGAMTALGGEAAKFIQRFFLNTTINMEDCGVTYGEFMYISPKEKDQNIGSFIVAPQGKAIELTEENYSQYAGKSAEVYSSLYCKAGNPNFCVKCMGSRYRGRPDAPASLAVDVGQILMYLFMKKMHGVALKTVKWDWRATADF